MCVILGHVSNCKVVTTSSVSRTNKKLLPARSVRPLVNVRGTNDGEHAGPVATGNVAHCSASLSHVADPKAEGRYFPSVRASRHHRAACVFQTSWVSCVTSLLGSIITSRRALLFQR